MKLFLGVLYVISLYSAYLAGSLYLRIRSKNADNSSKPAERPVPYATLLLAVAIVIPTTLQFFVPTMLQMFERDYTKFLQGEWWRLITSLFVQDRGLSGSIFNLVSILLMGMVAEELWGSQKWLILFFGGGILSQVVAFGWQPVGAGTSVANFSLAGGTAVLCLASDVPRPGNDARRVPRISYSPA